MGTAERRLEMLKYLCKVRKTTMPQLAEKFGVSIRTIQRDILEIEATFYVPLEITAGKYGGISVIGNYSFDRMYMCAEEIALLCKLQEIAKEQLNSRENILLSQIIKNYSKSA